MKKNILFLFLFLIGIGLMYLFNIDKQKKVILKTDLENAKVFLNNNYIGLTNKNFELKLKINKTKNNIKIVKKISSLKEDKICSNSLQIDSLKNDSNVFYIPLKNKCVINKDKAFKKEITIKTNEPNIDIYINNKKVGKTNYNKALTLFLEEGDYLLKAQKINKLDNGLIKCTKEEKIKVTNKTFNLFEISLKNKCKTILNKEEKFKKTELKKFYAYPRFYKKNNSYSVELYLYDKAISDIRNKLTIFPNIEYVYKINNNYVELFADFLPNVKYNFTLKKGFETNRKKLEKDKTVSLLIPNIEPTLKFENASRYASSYNEAITLKSVNVNNIEVLLYKVNKNNINYLNLFDRYSLKDSDYSTRIIKYSKLINKYDLVLKNKKNKEIQTQISLKKININSDGIYFIKVKDKDSYTSYGKVIIKSDLGVCAKVSKDQIFFMARTISKNKAIKNAKILLYSNNNKLIVSGTTNSNGIYMLNYVDILKSNPKLVVIKTEKQTNFLLLEDAINKYNILFNKDLLEKPYKGLLFFERELLRPVDKTKIYGIIRDDKFKSIPDLKVRLKILDPLKVLLVDKNIKLNKNSMFDYEFKTQNSYKTGTYEAQLFLGNTLVTRKNFRVESFIPNKIEVNLKTNKNEYLSKEKINIELKSKYLFGAKAKKLPYEIKILFNAKKYISKKYNEYYFYDNMQIKKHNEYFKEKRISGNLNNEGEVKKDFFLKDFLHNSNALISATILAGVNDDGNEVRKNKIVNIFPYKEIIGLKKNFKENYVKTNTNLKFKTILLDPLEDKKIDSNKEIIVKIYKKFYHYYAGVEFRKISEFQNKVNKDFNFMPEESGTYYITVSSPEGQVSSMSFYASGWGNEPVELNSQDSYKVNIIPNKNIYNINDQMEFNIKSPIAGKLLITLEENKIKFYKIFNMKKNNGNFKIKIPKTIQKGFYLKAYVVRANNVEDKLFPYRVMGSKYIKINNANKKIKIKIIAPKISKSNQEFEVKVKVNKTKNTKVFVTMVDFGIINILNQKPLRVFDYFDNKTKDNVSLFDIYSDLLVYERLKTQSPSGGMVKSMKMQKYLPDSAINSRVKPFSFGSKIVKVDKDGFAKVIFKIPNYNGKVLIQAVAINENSIGSNSKEIVYKDEIVVDSSIPRFLIQGDKVEIPLKLINTTNKNKKIILNIKTSDNLSHGLYDKKINLSANEIKKINVEFIAKKSKKSFIKIIAKENDNEYFIKTDFLIKTKYDNKVISKVGILKENSNKEFILDAKKDSKVYLTISPSPLSLLSKDFNDLITYPYGCCEQVSSKLMALILSKNVKQSYLNNTLDLSSRERYINKSIDKLLSMVNYNGFFTYWPGGKYVNYYASYYAFYVLKYAKENGYEIPDEILNKISESHKKYFKKHLFVSDYYLKYIPQDEANFIFDKKMYTQTLTSCIALASNMKKLNNDKAYKTIIDFAKKKFILVKQSNERKNNKDFYSSVRDIAFALALYSKMEKDNFASEMNKFIQNQVINNNLCSTQEKIFALMGLIEYNKNINNSEKGMQYTVETNGVKHKYNHSIYKVLELKNKKIKINNFKDEIAYDFNYNSKSILPVNSEKKLLEKKDIAIISNLINLETKKINDYENIKLGDKLLLKVELKANYKIENVAVNVLIPSCFEILNSRIYKRSKEYGYKDLNYYPEYVDYRDDRMISFLNISKKTSIFYIPLNVVAKGVFVNPIISVEAMYNTNLNDYYKAVKKIVVK